MNKKQNWFSYDDMCFLTLAFMVLMCTIGIFTGAVVLLRINNNVLMDEITSGVMVAIVITVISFMLLSIYLSIRTTIKKISNEK